MSSTREARIAGGPESRLEILAGPAFGGLDPHALAAEFGTPLFVYDLDVVSARVAALRAALPDRADLAYAVKANPSLAVVAHLVRLGLGVDIASGGELETVLRAGADPRRIAYTGPAKTDDELRRAIDVGVGTLTIESLQELERVGRLAAEAGAGVEEQAPQRLMLRIQSGGRGERQRIIGDGGRGKFGLVIDEIDAAVDRIRRTPSVRLVGVHSFGASNVLDARAILGHVAAVADLGREIGRRLGAPLEIIDVGGGLGIPYEVGEMPLDLELLAAGLRDEVSGWAAADLGDARLLLEPGRFLVGPAGVYLSRVVATKEREAGPVVLIDGGIHHLVRPALVRTEQRIIHVPSGSEHIASAPRASTVAGPLCTGLDILAGAAQFADARPGDLVGVLDAGAYGFTESMPYFLSHPQPAEVVIRDGKAHLVRPRLDPVAVLDRQLLLVD